MRLVYNKTGGRVTGQTNWGNRKREYMRKPYAVARRPTMAMTKSKKKKPPGFPGGFYMAPYRRSPRKPYYRPLKTRKLYYKPATNAGGSTTSNLTFGTKSVPRWLSDLYKQNQNYTYEYLTSNRRTSVFGKQAMTTYSMLDNIQLNQIIQTIPQITSAALIDTGKVYIEDVKLTQTYTNVDLATSYLTIYDIVPRFNIPLTTPIAMSPENAWDKGLEDQSLVPALNDNILDPYAKPFASQLFCLFYKINKVTTVELQQGQSHCHNVTHHINKPWYGQMSDIFFWHRNHTKFTLSVITGTPINDLTSKSLVSTSSCAVDIVTKQIVTYTYAAVQRTIRSSQNSLSAITSAEIASIGAGVVVNEDEA